MNANACDFLVAMVSEPKDPHFHLERFEISRNDYQWTMEISGHDVLGNPVFRRFGPEDLAYGSQGLQESFDHLHKFLLRLQREYSKIPHHTRS